LGCGWEYSYKLQAVSHKPNTNTAARFMLHATSKYKYSCTLQAARHKQIQIQKANTGLIAIADCRLPFAVSRSSNFFAQNLQWRLVQYTPAVKQSNGHS
jgi:hypothetical protein